MPKASPVILRLIGEATTPSSRVANETYVYNAARDSARDQKITAYMERVRQSGEEALKTYEPHDTMPFGDDTDETTINQAIDLNNDMAEQHAAPFAKKFNVLVSDVATYIENGRGEWEDDSEGNEDSLEREERSRLFV